MSYTGDPLNNLIDKFRLKVGDTDEFEEILSDSVYEFILAENGITAPYNPTTDIPPQAIIEALTYIVNRFANYSHEEAGDLEIWDERYDRYRNLLDNYLKDPRYGFATGVPFAGGISISDIEANRFNSDAKIVKPYEDWFKDNTLSKPYKGRL